MIPCVILIILLSSLSLSLGVNVTVNTTSPVRSIQDKFLSIAFDSGHAYSPTFGISFSVIAPLAKALGPAYFRFGGGIADTIYFQFNQTAYRKKRDVENATAITFTANQLDQICNFTKNVGWRFIFDLNLMLRTNGKWNSSNVQHFLDYASQKGYVMDFELGNEPDGFPLATQFNITINGSQIANDYGVLRSLLNTYSLYKNSIIIGPSVAYYAQGTLGQQIIFDFLNNGGGNYIGGLTFHFYYFAGATATVSNFLDYKMMDKLLSTINLINQLNYRPIWIGESASAYNGGAVNMSDTYLDGFIWLDELGLSALHGMEIVLRQQISGGNYGLLDSTMHPNHDYWVAFLHKKLIGSQVYNLSADVSDLNLRLYAASSKTISNGVVVYGVRLSNVSTTIDFPQFSTRHVTVYIFKEDEPGNLQSQNSTLNGQLLAWNPHLPGDNYQGVVSNLPITIPGYSQFFIVYDPNSETTCPNGWYKETSNSNKCIQFINGTQPYFGAKFDCASFGQDASILIIENPSESVEIYNTARSKGCNQFYIGLERSGYLGSWSWSNDAPINFQNWTSGYPVIDGHANCAVIDTTTGKWVNVDCDAFQCYICQKYV